ncbi:MAG TPA: hypothetical protein VE954_19395, partial [Oligoflexus sp.]|uniref:alpha/beta fold hydrolase n=1 Tax=Oligoflexus sp. TaxID=1971216 RepID=UPI002D452753
VAGDKDRFTPYPICLKLHQGIPGADLLTVPTGSHIGPLELPEFIHLRIEKFITDKIKVADKRPDKASVEVQSKDKGKNQTKPAAQAKKKSKSR